MLNLRLPFVLVTILAGSSLGVVKAHEGHAPLPTKGVQVDIKKGLITLSPDAQRSLGVQTTAIENRALEDTALAYAKLMTPWQQQYFVSSPLSGRIAALHVTTGSMVKSGELLAEIASPELDAIQLELRSAVNSLDLSSRQAERLRKLVAEQAVPERDFIEANTKFQQDKSAVEIARTKLQSLGISKEAIDLSVSSKEQAAPLVLPLVSPIAGSVSHADLAIGKVVVATEHLFEVNDLSKLWAKIGVLERDVARVKAGQKLSLELTAFPKQPLLAEVVGNTVEVDPVTHVATVWAEIINPEGATRYLPGMYGTAKIITSGPGQSLTAPSSALLGSGAERYVLVEVAATAKGYEYRRQNVVVLSQSATLVQIQADALYPGDRVVKLGGQVLSSFFILGSLRLSKEGIRNVGLKVEPVAKQPVEDILQLEGLIDVPPGRAATISSQLAGVLTRLHVDRGEQVKSGQILAEVFGLPLLDTQLEMLKSALDAKLLDETLTRLKSTGPSAVVAVRRIWEAESARDAAVNRRDSARQSLITMGMTAKEVEEVLESGHPKPTLPIRSPIDGVVVRLDKTLGEGVSADEAILEVHDLSHPWVKAFLAEADAPKIAIGSEMRVRLLSDPGFLASGKVVKSASMLGTENRTLSVWIEFNDSVSKPLQRNLLSQITAITGKPRAVLAVPLAAIVREQTQNYVFVQKKDDLLERRHVDLGRADDRFVEIKKGLTAGELIAVQGAAELQTTYASVR